MLEPSRLCSLITPIAHTATHHLPLQQDFGICAQILKAPPAPVLGVCLGCQGIGWMYGLDVRKAPGGAVHGRTSAVFHNEAARGGGGLFAGIPNGFKVVRYHSLAICSTNAGDPFPEDSFVR